MKTSEKWLLALGVVTLLGTFGVVTLGQPADRKRDALGAGDDQGKEGFGIDAQLQLGQLPPVPGTRWHYGPGEGNLPTSWARHRLAYPRRQSGDLDKCGRTPMTHPAFPRADRIWFYHPPQEVNL